MSRLDDLIVLRNSVDDEIRDHIPQARYRTAHEWLLLLPPDLNASLHRAELEAELSGARGDHRSPKTLAAWDNKTSPTGECDLPSQALDQHTPLREGASRGH